LFRDKLKAKMAVKNECKDLYNFVPLTTGHIKVAGLLVQGEEGEVHGASAGEADPDGVKDVAVRKHSHVQILLKDVVEPSDLLIAEKGIRHPHLGSVRHS